MSLVMATRADLERGSRLLGANPIVRRAWVTNWAPATAFGELEPVSRMLRRMMGGVRTVSGEDLLSGAATSSVRPSPPTTKRHLALDHSLFQHHTTTARRILSAPSPIEIYLPLPQRCIGECPRVPWRISPLTAASFQNILDAPVARPHGVADSEPPSSVLVD